MPELPEVETVVRDLRPHLTDRRIGAVRSGKKALRKPWRPAGGKKLVGQQIAAVRRRGKWIVLDLTDGGHLVIHLGMTGQLRVHAAADAVADHTHLVFRLDDGRELRFCDIRRFGSATWFVSTLALDAAFAAAKLGPEPFDLRIRFLAGNAGEYGPLHQGGVAGSARRRRRRQHLRGRVPLRGLATSTSALKAASSLRVSEADRLRKAIAVVLKRGIEKRGSSIRNYVGGSGLKGGYQDEFRVYGRKDVPCRVCDTPITRIRLAGRSTHFCPTARKRRNAEVRMQRGSSRTRNYPASSSKSCFSVFCISCSLCLCG